MTSNAIDKLKSHAIQVILILAGMLVGFYFFRAKAEKPAPPPPVAKTELSGITSIAIDGQDRLFAGGEFGIKELNKTFKPVRGIQTSETVQALALDAAGNFYALYGTSLEKFDASGKSLRQWGKTGPGGEPFKFGTGIAIGDDHVFVADAGLKMLFHFSLEGEPRNEIASLVENATEPGYFVPTPFFDCATHDKTLYVANPGYLRVEEYDFNGSLMIYWGKGGAKKEEFPGCSNPAYLAVCPNGNITVSQKGEPCVKVYSPEGAFLEIFGEDVFLPHTRGIDLAVDSQGKIYAVDPEAAVIRVFESKFNTASVEKKEGNAP